MFATLVNCLAIIIGSLIGIGIGSRIKDEFRNVIYIGAGIATLVLGMNMAFSSTKPIYLSLALLGGGLLGTWWKIDGGILALGHFLERISTRGPAHNAAKIENGWDFGRGFLNGSVLFCVGAMALIGSFKAGAEGDYNMIFTKSVLDGFIAILFAAAMGPGVAFSALSILVYQGALTLGARAIRPWVSPLMLDELSGLGGALIIMIALNLLHLKEIKTANFLPALILMAIFVLLDPFIANLGQIWGIFG